MEVNYCPRCVNCEYVAQVDKEGYWFCHEANTKIENIDFQGENCKCFEEDNWCSDCDTEFAEYIYKDEKYCPQCLLNQLVNDNKVESWTVTHYMIDGEYYGNDNDNDREEIAENIAKSLKIKKME